MAELEAKTETEWMMQAVEAFDTQLGQSLSLTATSLAHYDDDTRWQIFADFLYRANLLAINTPVAQIKTAQAVYRSASLNHARYQPSTRVDVPITLFRAQQEPPKEHQRGNFKLDDWDWQNHTKQAVTVHWVPGNHGNLLDEPQVKNLADKLAHNLSHINSENAAC